MPHPLLTSWKQKGSISIAVCEYRMPGLHIITDPPGRTSLHALIQAGSQVNFDSSLRFLLDAPDPETVDFSIKEPVWKKSTRILFSISGPPAIEVDSLRYEFDLAEAIEVLAEPNTGNGEANVGINEAVWIW